MRARTIVPVVLAVALVTGLLVGARIPIAATATATGPAAHPTPGGTDDGGSPEPAPDGSPAPPAGEQPNLENYPITRLARGEQPPQFVVVSFDGSCSHELFQHYFDLGQETNSRFTFFMSGLCLVPDAEHNLYHPPRQPVGTSAIGFADPKNVTDRIRDWSKAYDNGYGVGTHFLGHFCEENGVGTWSAADWRSELDQQQHFFDDWAQVNANNKYADLSVKPSFPFSAVQGDRTPCLAGKRDQMYKAFAERHFTYDSSNGGTLTWPRKMKKYDLWNIPLQRLSIKDWPGNRSVLSMDYNLLYTMNNAKTTAPRATCDKLRRATYATYMGALDAVENGNRAPLIIGNHFNTWVCGAFRDALTDFVRDAHTRYPYVRFVSFEYLVKWMEAQDPKVLKALQARPAPSY